MKAIALTVSVTLCLAASSARATIFTDSVGDTFAGVGGGGILDIVSAEVTDDGTNINFKVNIASDPVATDWGKYMVMIDTVPGGDNAGNGWGRPIGWGQGGALAGADYWLGSWVDSGNGAENRKWDGVSAWFLQDASYTNSFINTTKNNSSVTISTGLSRLGLGAGQTFCFDIFSSGGGGGDGAIDSLGNPNQQVANWGDPSIAHPEGQNGQALCYTTTPEPGSLVLIGLGALAIIRRRR